MEIKDFFYLLIVLSVTRNNVKVKKVIISLKNPSKWSIMNSTYCGGHMRKSMKKDTRNPKVLITHRLGI